jgi:SAM-dependent methyltransferase
MAERNFMNIYDYCAAWIAKNAKPGISILDYGCGAGTIIQEVRDRGFDAYGCDVFYQGGNYSSQVPSNLMENGIIKRMNDGRIPYDDASFDLVINNLVMEHVPDLEAVLLEISRVMKPGGKVLSLFPDRGVWREGHVGIPFLHWFPKGSRLRVVYAFVLRSLGLGYHKLNKPHWQWSEDACAWIDNWTYYRSLRVIRDLFNRCIGTMHGLEADYFKQRLGKRAWLLQIVPRFVLSLVVRKMGCLVFETRKS